MQDPAVARRSCRRRPSTCDRERAERAHADAEKLLLTDLSEEEFIETQKKLFRAVARLENLNNN